MPGSIHQIKPRDQCFGPDRGGSAEDDDEEYDDLDGTEPLPPSVSSISSVPELVSEPTGSANQAPPEAELERLRRQEVAQRQNIRNCPICWEEQPHLAQRGGVAGRDRTAMLQKVQDFRKIIFRFERMLCGRQNDETVFHGMLELRRTFIERYLDEHGFRYQRWTMQLLRDHYDPTGGHRFDPIRELNSELTDLRRMKKWTMQYAMFAPNPDTGEQMFNVRAVDVRLRVSKQYNDTMSKMTTELRRRDEESAVDARMVMETVNDAVNRLTGARAAPDADAVDPLGAMYDVGGV